MAANKGAGDPQYSDAVVSQYFRAGEFARLRALHSRGASRSKAKKIKAGVTHHGKIGMHGQPRHSDVWHGKGSAPGQY